MNQDNQLDYSSQPDAQTQDPQVPVGNSDNLTFIATQPSTRSRSRLPVIIGIVVILLVAASLAGGFIWWQSDQQKTKAQQEVASVVREFFEAARLYQTDRLDQIAFGSSDKKFIDSYHNIAKQIGRECRAEPEDAVIKFDNSSAIATMNTTCMPDQSWTLELARDSELSWKITSVEGTNLVPDIQQALAVDPYASVSIYEDENKPKPDSCLVPEDAALFNGTSLPRDPFLYFHDENILFETESLKYFPTEKATDQFDALERFYRLTAQRRYYFIVIPESYASQYKQPILEIASNRAEAVQESLLKRGIPRERIVIENPVDGTRTKPEQSRGVTVKIQASRTCEP